MLSASLRAYRGGRETEEARRRIVRDYLNSIPLSAAPGYGEVHGLGDGLAVWFGADFGEVNRLLRQAANGLEDPGELARAACAYRQVLSLLLAVKKPSEYLLADRAALERRVEMYLKTLAREGVVPGRLAAEALRTRVEFRDRIQLANPVPFSQRKGTNLVRVELMEQLGLRSLYDLDRLDLKVATSLDGDAQREVAAFLARLKDSEFATAAGLRGPRLLGRDEDTSRVIYSVTLYERTPEANVLRVHADNYDQPLDINAQTKLELGSTAKLRTLVHYLQVIAELHERFSARNPEELAALELAREDRLSQWAREYLLSAPDKSLEAMLEAAMMRRYSASPAETFFTGGGAHRFSNFDAADNGRILTIREAFHRSVNLVFIRLMRDLVYYHLMRLPEVTPAVLDDAAHPERRRILAQFADWEGSVFLTGFYRKYEGLKGDEALQKLVSGLRSKTPRRLAVIYRSVRPDVGINGFAAFLIGNLLDPNLKDSLIRGLYEAYSPQRFSLADRAYLAGVHPLELWLLEYKARRPQATLKEVLAAGEQVRQESYTWLFQAKNKRAQDRAIRIMLEREAFKEVHRVWKRTGFPFSRLVPSYATSIGSSGDTPAALAELIGIIVNDGVRRPTIRVRQLQFAEHTPFETILAPRLEAREQVLPEAVARQVRRELVGVVETGTARRAWRSIVLSGGEVVPVGGKTGTGDNRYEAYARSGTLIASRVVNRTATFVFVIGDRFFGTVTAFVPGEAAASYRFTSSLPVQVFKDLGPLLVSLVEKQETESASLWPGRPSLVARLAGPPVLR
jgi:membrane peptidoglycan carboxypeptidase